MVKFLLDPVIASADRGKLARAGLTRQLNDTFRMTFAGGKVLLSQGVAALHPDARNEVLRAVRLFSEFSPENDPYEEHDFGAVMCRDVRYFWKVDYYDLELRHRSPDPSDPAFTIRVLTIMRGDEY
ncbi:MAG: DUF3768 domain-containing protein [Mesorhizobium sp.]